jgi:chromosome segregation ATPase
MAKQTALQRARAEIAAITDQIASLQPQLQERDETIARLNKVVREQVDAKEQERMRADRIGKERDQVATENDNLRDELNRMAVENARLRGYQERVREFDPVTERQAYQDSLPRAGRDTYGASSVEEHGALLSRVRGLTASGADRPWYRRRG